MKTKIMRFYVGVTILLFSGLWTLTVHGEAVVTLHIFSGRKPPTFTIENEEILRWLVATVADSREANLPAWDGRKYRFPYQGIRVEFNKESEWIGPNFICANGIIDLESAERDPTELVVDSSGFLEEYLLDLAYNLGAISSKELEWVKRESDKENPKVARRWNPGPPPDIVVPPIPEH